jgi:hypothetical protein
MGDIVGMDSATWSIPSPSLSATAPSTDPAGDLDLVRRAGEHRRGVAERLGLGADVLGRICDARRPRSLPVTYGPSGRPGGHLGDARLQHVQRLLRRLDREARPVLALRASQS